ncbi:MAG: hypothetical protein AB7U29_12735 [Desulfobulbus sp.]
MAPFLTSEKVLELLKLNEDSLVFYIQDKQLTAYDRSYKTVDLAINEKNFTEIKELCEPVIAKNVLLRKAKINPYVQDPVFDTQEIRGDKKYCRIRVSKDGEWIKLPDLHQILSSAGPEERWPVITIPESQYLAIKAGWNQDRIREVFLSSLFKKSEVDSLQVKNKDHAVNPKTERNDLLIIGGLLGLIKEHEGKLTSDAQIIAALNEWMPSTPGYSKRNLEKRFALAKKAIEQQE